MNISFDDLLQFTTPTPPPSSGTSDGDDLVSSIQQAISTTDDSRSKLQVKSPEDLKAESPNVESQRSKDDDIIQNIKGSESLHTNKQLPTTDYQSQSIETNILSPTNTQPSTSGGDLGTKTHKQQTINPQSPTPTLQNPIPSAKPPSIMLDDLITPKNQLQVTTLDSLLTGTPTPDAIISNSFTLESLSSTSHPLPPTLQSPIPMTFPGLLGDTTIQGQKKPKVWIWIIVALLAICGGVFYLITTRPLLFSGDPIQRGSNEIEGETTIQTPVADMIDTDTTGRVILPDTDIEIVHGEQVDISGESTNTTEKITTSVAPSLGFATSETIQLGSTSGSKANTTERLGQIEQDTIQLITQAQTAQEKKVFIKGQLLLKNISKLKDDLNRTDVDTETVITSLDTMQNAIIEMQQQLQAATAATSSQTATESAPTSTGAETPTTGS